ncbi:DUF7689 domain-containing protein [Leptospira interrogans]|uniref:DUF7689 domain-containing protein n=1 Tax=Leptospira interrogans TaxID=173 RepID=UPI00177C30F6|nr:hypothetical protein [Leptospira interrogans]MBE0305267.1 hypothetical protein [Leptospira interrogans serovar Yeoncheon]
MTLLILPEFPNSLADPFVITSNFDECYNCIAWAYGDSTKWYWPDEHGLAFWPNDIPHETTLTAFQALFERIGYEICDNGVYESGYEKIAIFTNEDKSPTHAAKQLNNDTWSSKLEIANDVSHTILSISSGAYGSVAIYMRRLK